MLIREDDEFRSRAAAEFSAASSRAPRFALAERRARFFRHPSASIKAALTGTAAAGGSKVLISVRRQASGSLRLCAALATARSRAARRLPEIVGDERRRRRLGYSLACTCFRCARQPPFRLHSPTFACAQTCVSWRHHVKTSDERMARACRRKFEEEKSHFSDVKRGRRLRTQRTSEINAEWRVGALNSLPHHVAAAAAAAAGKSATSRRNARLQKNFDSCRL